MDVEVIRKQHSPTLWMAINICTSSSDGKLAISRKVKNKHLFSNLLEKAMAPHSSVLAWKISWTEEPGGLQSMRLLRVGHD